MTAKDFQMDVHNGDLPPSLSFVYDFPGLYLRKCQPFVAVKLTQRKLESILRAHTSCAFTRFWSTIARLSVRRARLYF